VLHGVGRHTELTERQRVVLRGVIGAYVAEAAPVGSVTLSHLLPTRLSSASIRSTLAELTEFDLIDKPHTSAGRVPTEKGFRLFIDQLLAPQGLAEDDRRTIDFQVDEAELGAVYHTAAQLLSEQTRLLGFVVAPPIDEVVLCHVSLVRLTAKRILAVLVADGGTTYRRVIDDRNDPDQRELDRIAALLNQRVAGRTLCQVRSALEREARRLRRQAGALLAKALELGSRALSADEDGTGAGDLVIATRLALLEQPEFRDPERIRELYEAIETKERLLDVLHQVLEGSGVCVALGGEVDDPALRRCALVACHYGGTEGRPMGVLGVIGPNRMDYARVISLVDYFSRVVTEKLSA
jgi:heat-inducible transcriptional repressor